MCKKVFNMRRIASKSKKAVRTERDALLQRKQIYEHMEEKVQQQRKVDTMLDGFSAEPDEIQVDELTREWWEPLWSR